MFSLTTVVCIYATAKSRQVEMITQMCAAIAVYANSSTCSSNCGLQCSGYGQLPDASCPAHITPPCCGVCNNVGATPQQFVEWTPITASRAGCHSNNECLVCPDNANRTFEVRSKHTVYLSEACTHYVPDNDYTVKATLMLERNPRDVTLVGPGVVLSPSWPLTPGRNFRVLNQVEFRRPPPLLQANPGSAPLSAVHIVENAAFSVDARAPTFAALVSVSSPSATPMTLPSATVRGYAREVVLATAHVSGAIDVECTGANQSLILQESLHDILTLTFAETSQCSKEDEINLAAMLGAYGQQYDVLFFEGKMPKVVTPAWKEAEYVWYVAGTLFLAIALSHQRELYDFVTKR